MAQEDLKEETYSNSRIVAWRNIFEEHDDKKGKIVLRKVVCCLLYRSGSKNQPLNLGECNDGKVFTSINQAINQAKQIVDQLGD